MAEGMVRRGKSRAKATGSMLRGAMTLLVVAAVLAFLLAGWGTWQLRRGEPLPEWLGRLAVVSGLTSGEQLAEVARDADERRVADAVWRNAAANRARALAGVRAVAWDGDRLLVLLTPGMAPSGATARAVCEVLEVAGDQQHPRVRVESLDGQGAPVEAWCGSGVQ